ncbi:MAG: ATP-binding cassette domain-containing protein [Cellvibrionaceae bacterium]
MTSQYLPLRAQQVHLIFDKKTCLSNINLEIISDGITVIMGHNGCGKTLLLKLFAGLYKSTGGTVHWQQHPIPPQLTFVPQKAVLLSTSVENNILKPLLYHRIDNAAMRCQQALDWAGISYLSDQSAINLSTGEQQLVALARAWALDPKVLLLDEPSANLDPTRKQHIDHLVKQMSSSCKIILSTHNIQQARELATDIVLLEHGKLLTHLIADDFFSSAEFMTFSGIQ